MVRGVSTVVCATAPGETNASMSKANRRAAAQQDEPSRQLVSVEKKRSGSRLRKPPDRRPRRPGAPPRFALGSMLLIIVQSKLGPALPLTNYIFSKTYHAVSDRSLKRGLRLRRLRETRLRKRELPECCDQGYRENPPDGGFVAALPAR